MPAHGSAAGPASALVRYFRCSQLWSRAPLEAQSNLPWPSAQLLSARATVPDSAGTYPGRDVGFAGEPGAPPTVFGKNSDRPNEEVLRRSHSGRASRCRSPPRVERGPRRRRLTRHGFQVHEIVRCSSKSHEPGTKVQTQYIQIPQAEKTHAIVLSRPAWLWGAEMGANEHGLCAGNEAVFSREAAACDDGKERLLGMDLVRLVLERARTAREAVDVAAALLEAHGQGGPCEERGKWCYENGFLFADAVRPPLHARPPARAPPCARGPRRRGAARR